MPNSLGVVVLAAGQGTRMKSQLHKVLHPLAGLPMIDHVLRAARAISPDRLVVVVGHGADEVRAHLGDEVEYSLQDPPLGTGDAVRQTRPRLEGVVDTVLVMYGDTPLLRPETLRRLVDVHLAERPLVTMLTGRTHDPGRVLRDEVGRVAGVVEEKVATSEQLLISERNSGVYVFQADWLWPQVSTLEESAVGEYYLTDLIGRAVVEGERDGCWPVVAVESSDPLETMGVNDRVQLAAAESVIQQRILERIMLSGVTVLDPSNTYVQVDVEVGQDTTLLPGTHLMGNTRVGRGCTIGPSSSIVDSVVGDGCRVQWSVVESSRIDDRSDLGPFSHLRPGTHVADHVHVGNYVEMKNTRIGSGSACGHVSYLGDAEIGENVNIGAGTITANFDKKTRSKHPTTIGDGAFIGVDTMLVAPVEVGEGASTGAGAVVTRNVDPGRLVVGVPARPVPRRVTETVSPESAGEGS